MPDRELQIFGQPCRWRETMRYPRALFCDARIVLFVGIAAVDISLRSVVLLASAMAVFLILEHMGMTVPAALRQLRTIGAGRSRRATSPSTSGNGMPRRRNRLWSVVPDAPGKPFTSALAVPTAGSGSNDCHRIVLPDDRYDSGFCCRDGLGRPCGFLPG